MTRFFTFVIPFGCTKYLPLLYLLGKTTHQAFNICSFRFGLLLLFCLVLVFGKSE
ncbi:ABC-2 family transporter protein [Pullulanibacillus camelliae]|uniref:ABC-2 family transporter protein n=1 Tax=Pullulanibacillus camelliae TaxID=1707096 RepID=UPI001E53FEC2|nr:ABC-2 family transporter protein [Pullulanibacillus camelliae]